MDGDNERVKGHAKEAWLLANDYDFMFMLLLSGYGGISRLVEFGFDSTDIRVFAQLAAKHKILYPVTSGMDDSGVFVVDTRFDTFGSWLLTTAKEGVA